MTVFIHEPKGIVAFYLRTCKNLVSVVVPNSVTTLGDWVFAGCESLEAATLPNSLTLVPTGTFSCCTKLSLVNLPQTIKYISYQAFDACWSLTSIEIPVSVTDVGYEAFSRCIGLTSIVIPDSVEYIYEYAFAQCTNLNSVKISNSTIIIGDYAFLNCSLTIVVIPNSVEDIRIGAFKGNPLIDITVPKSVTKLPTGEICDEPDVFFFFVIQILSLTRMRLQDVGILRIFLNRVILI